MTGISVIQSKPQNAKSGIGIGPHHPICRGDFAAIVFCGRTDDLGELPGEPTAHAIYKFVLADSRLDAGEDFARSAGSDLPQWPVGRIRPIDGVCFVFTDAENPAIDSLIHDGAKEHQHYVIVGCRGEVNPVDALRSRLSRFAEMIPEQSRIVILGYGHQGSQIARSLGEMGLFDRQQIVIHDANIDSQRKAVTDGFALIGHDRILREATGVIYSPQMRHQRLHAMLIEADRAGLPVLDNSQISSTLKQFVSRGDVLLDAAADGALIVERQRVRAKPHGLAFCGQLIREERRRIAGVEFPHLHSGHTFTLLNQQDAIDLSAPSPFDALAATTLASSRCSFISLRNRADHGFFAARDLCSRLWPQATREVFPSEHVIDLGATTFERMLQGHLVGREIASTMQTPAQRATLGIVARHYAANRPMIEIGSAFGGSALLMAAATDEQRPPIHSIDPEASTRDFMRFAFEREGHLPRLHQHIKTSDHASADLQHLQGNAGLVFIDGLHTQQGVASDFENYSPLVIPGGALLFHDVCPQIHSVFRVVMERVLTDPRFEIMCLVDGLAVFERRR